METEVRLQTLETWRFLLPEIVEMLRTDPREIPEALIELHPADVGEIINNLPVELIPRFLDVFPIEQAADFFEYTSEAIRKEVIPLMDFATAAALLDAMEPDEQAAIVAELPQELQQNLLHRLTPANQEEALQILQYPDHTAGRIMTTEYISVPSTATVKDAIDAVKRGLPTRESYYNVYIVDKQMLRGVVSIRDLLLADENVPLNKIMESQVITVQPEEDQEQVARQISKYDLVSIPVATQDGRMLGVVTVDDVIDVLVEEQTEDVQKQSAMVPIEYAYFETKLWTIIRKRAGWLVLLFVSEFFTGTALRHYTNALEHALTLVFFIPLIMSSGGNSGSQSSTLVTRGLAIGDISLNDFLRVGGRELLSGFLLGAILGVIGFFRALTWHSPIPVAITVGLSLMGVVTAGCVIGSLMPLILKRMGLDPAISSSPFIATFIDVTGIIIYFTIAKAILLQ